MTKFIEKSVENKLTFDSFEDFVYYFNIEKILDSKYFVEATTHSSISKKKNYERLEFLGDTILNFCVSKMIFNVFPNDNEGALSKKKSYLITRLVCRAIAYQIHLDKQVRFLNNGTMSVDTIIADILESIICVIYYEYSIDKVYEVVYSLFLPHLHDFELDDPKMKLQEYTQKHFKTLPIYRLIKKEGNENAPYFLMSVECGGTIVEGGGKSKKVAEKQCATNMLKALKIK